MGVSLLDAEDGGQTEAVDFLFFLFSLAPVHYWSTYEPHAGFSVSEAISSHLIRGHCQRCEQASKVRVDLNSVLLGSAGVETRILF